MKSGTAPPVIGDKHRVFLRREPAIVAFSAQGRHLWDCKFVDAINGVTVTPDDHVLAGSGRYVYAVDRDGKARPVADAGENVSAAPVITSQGGLLVGAEKGVVEFSGK